LANPWAQNDSGKIRWEFQCPDRIPIYDGANQPGGIPYSKGKLTKVASSVSTTEYTEFDILGRVKAHKQTTDGQSYTTGYTYNLAGALIEETYQSGCVVKNTFDTDGSLSMVQSSKCGSVSVGGRVLTAAGRGIFGATDTLIDANGNARQARTDSFGYYRFEDVAAGQTVIVQVRHKRYDFAPQVLSVAEEVNNVNFTAAQ
jgi:YD repeat-containing protein